MLIICNLCISSCFLSPFYFKRNTGFTHTQYTGKYFEIMNISIKSCTLYQKRSRLRIRIWEILFRNYSFMPKVPFCMLFIFKIPFVVTETQLLILFRLWYSPLFDLYREQPWLAVNFYFYYESLPTFKRTVSN